MPDYKLMGNLSRKTRVFNILRNLLRIGRLDIFLSKFTNGKGPDNRLVKLIPNHYQFPKNSLRVCNRKGIVFEADISDWIGWNAYFGVTTKADKELFSLVNPGDTVIDIGTNIGYVLLRFSQRVEENGVVIGFEPDPYCYKQCLNNISLNSFSNVNVYNLALAHKADEFLLSIDSGGNRGGNRITNMAEEKAIKIKAITLDEFCKTNHISKIDLIKIDVEGFEMNVLRGGYNTLQTIRPALFIEINNNHLLKQGTSAKEVISKLRSLNYVIRIAGTQEYVSVNQNFENCHFDAVCTPENVTNGN